MKLQSYKELIVWQKSIVLVKEVYKLTSTFPKEEVFGLTSQMRRCSVSIPSNIAEGWSRRTRNDFLHFLRIAYGSGAELETELEIAKQLSMTSEAGYNAISSATTEIMRMLNGMMKKNAISVNYPLYALRFQKCLYLIS